MICEFLFGVCAGLLCICQGYLGSGGVLILNEAFVLL